MKRILLIIFLLPIGFSFIFLLGSTIFSMGMAPSYLSAVFPISFILGIFIYIKLFKMVREGSQDKNKFLSMWLLMILAFFLLPVIYFISERNEDIRVAKLNVIWFQEHCNPIQKGIMENGYSYETQCRYLKEIGF